MKEYQYKVICNLCDEILKSTRVNVEKVCIANLHVLNEHPVTLEKYKNFFSGSRAYIFALAKFSVRLFFRLFTRAANYKIDNSLRIDEKGIDVIFISHLLNLSQINDKEDFYFGSLPTHLAHKNHSSLTVLNNHTDISSKKLVCQFVKNSPPRMMLADNLSYVRELALRYLMLRQSFLLYKQSFKEKDKMKGQALVYAATHALSLSSINLLRFYFQIQDLIRSAKPKSIVVTYEGHAWEKLAFSAARSIDPSIRCLGYQHAILFPRQHAIKCRLGKEYDPDVILAAGDVTRDILENEKSLENTKIVTVGTHRQEKAVSDIYNKYGNNIIPSCLVIPDGNVEDCINIIKFAYKLALTMAKIRFVIRMHPLLVFREVVSNYPELQIIPNNIEISQLDIISDFSRCSWALYRGSGAAIRSTTAGLRPIYLSLDNELDIDPLYKLNAWKRTVVNVDEFISIIENDLVEDVGVLNKEFVAARDYCRNYFTPINIDKFTTEILS